MLATLQTGDKGLGGCAGGDRVSTSTRAAGELQWTSRGQASLYLATGIWPLLSPRSFQAVTGRKHDFWLAQTVGALVGVVGATLAIASVEERSLRSAPIRTLAAGSALSLAAVDIVFVTRRRISPVYLADAAAELALAGLWLRALRRPR
jgi:hypothetical protein